MQPRELVSSRNATNGNVFPLEFNQGTGFSLKKCNDVRCFSLKMPQKGKLFPKSTAKGDDSPKKSTAPKIQLTGTVPPKNLTEDVFH